MSTTSMKGKTVIVTGASRGIGRAAALAIGKMGADLVLVVRDKARGEEVAKEIRDGGGAGSVDVKICDFSVQADIRRCANELAASLPKLDVLVNNAGAVFMERLTTKDGLEMTFATNHLGYFLFTELLLDLLKKSKPARIVNVASDAHKGATMDFGDLQSETKYSGISTYSRSKLANILFTRELSKRLEGTGVTVNALHPGVIASNFGHNNKGFWGFMVKLASPFLMNEDDGAKTTIHLATSPDVEGVTGKYFVKCKEKRPSRAAEDDDAAKKLWEMSEKLVQESASAAS